MHSSLTFHSYWKPVTSLQVPKMYNQAHNPALFSIDLDVTQLIFHHFPLNRAVELYNAIFKIFSVIKIDKYSLNHKF